MARDGPLPLESVEHGRRFAADVPARAHVQTQVQVEPRTQDVVAEIPSSLGLSHGSAQVAGRGAVLGTDEHVRHCGANGVRG